MNTKIKHKGTILKIQGNHVEVRILQASACSSCDAKGLCSSAESKEKVIEVYSEKASSFHVGEEVVLTGTFSQGMKAVVYAYIIPLVLLLLVLFLGMAYLENEALAALLALSSLLPYYFLVYLCRNYLSQKFSFTLETTNK